MHMHVYTHGNTVVLCVRECISARAMYKGMDIYTSVYVHMLHIHVRYTCICIMRTCISQLSTPTSVCAYVFARVYAFECAHVVPIYVLYLLIGLMTYKLAC